MYASAASTRLRHVLGSSVRRCPSVNTYIAWGEWRHLFINSRNFSETCHKYSSCEWKFFWKCLLGSEVVGQGHTCTNVSMLYWRRHTFLRCDVEADLLRGLTIKLRVKLVLIDAGNISVKRARTGCRPIFKGIERWLMGAEALSETTKEAPTGDGSLVTAAARYYHEHWFENPERETRVLTKSSGFTNQSRVLSRASGREGPNISSSPTPLRKSFLATFMPILFMRCTMYAVLDGGIESALQALNAEYGDQIQMTCTPLRSFEDFAEQVLYVEHDLARTPFKRVTGDPDDRLYWLTFTVSYRGSCS